VHAACFETLDQGPQQVGLAAAAVAPQIDRRGLRGQRLQVRDGRRVAAGQMVVEGMRRLDADGQRDLSHPP